jgi:hypothetical protein
MQQSRLRVSALQEAVGHRIVAVVLSGERAVPCIGSVPSVEEIRVSQDGSIDVVEALGELDMSDVAR